MKAELVEEPKQSLEKTGPSVLSISNIKNASEIQKLGKKIYDRLRGDYSSL
jgi:hypothetical protein